jgi:hypothetical protein
MEVMAYSIYRVSERWCPIRRNCADGQEGGGVSHCDDLPWRSQGNELRWLLKSHYGSWQRDKCPKAWHPHGEWRTRRWWPLGHIAGANGWITERTVPPSSSAARSFTRESLSTFIQAWIMTLARINAQGRRRWGTWTWRSDLNTVPSESWFRAPDRPLCRAQISHFHVNTY